MTPPEHFHACHHCSKFSINLENKPSSSNDKEDIPPDIFFFDATLEDVLNGLTERCELCLWLDSLWGGDSSSSCRQYGILKTGENTSSIVVCAETYSMSLVDRYPVDEIMFFGLWEEDAVMDPHWGKCRVFAKCSVDVFTTLDDTASELIRNRPINRFPGSAENLERARQWLLKCQTSHAKCTEVSQTYMPLRVLRISRGYGSCDFDITLETKANNNSFEPFAALSYCWGGNQPYKTTKARMQSSQVSLEWHKLPKSLQDSIRITSALGLQCLWVDSLCIIQDDEEDKALQIGDMARVYNNATITIIASRASRAIDGFLEEVDVTSQIRLAVRLPFQCPGQEPTVGSAYLAHIEGSRDSSEPIDSRAWTLQERYLSNRVLEFGSLQTRWTCAASSATSNPSSDNGNYADGWKWDKNSESHTSQMMYLHTDLLGDLAEFARQHSGAAWIREWLHVRWYTVLGEYTPRLLSVPTDRILGISGVADIFLSHLRNEGRDETEEYLAGLWRSTLPSALCWHTVSGKGASTQPLRQTPQMYQGPSWSWTGINCHVLFLFSRACDRDCRAVLLDADVKLANASAKCGSVTSAILTLEGRMRQSFWNVVDGTLHVHLDEDELRREGEIRHASKTTRVVQLATVYPDTPNSIGGVSEQPVPQVPVWLLEIGQCAGLKKRGPVGLVLKRVNVLCGNGLPRFRRLGLFHINTRQAPGTPLLLYRSAKHLPLEDQANLFEGQIAATIELE